MGDHFSRDQGGTGDDAQQIDPFVRFPDDFLLNKKYISKNLRAFDLFVIVIVCTGPLILGY